MILSPTDIATIVLVLYNIANMFIQHKYADLGAYLVKEMKNLVESTLTNKEKRDLIIGLAQKVMPVYFKPFLTEEKVGALVDLLYVTKVKPKAKLDGLEGVPKDLTINEAVLDAANKDVNDIFSLS